MRDFFAHSACMGYFFLFLKYWLQWNSWAYILILQFEQLFSSDCLNFLIHRRLQNKIHKIAIKIKIQRLPWFGNKRPQSFHNCPQVKCCRWNQVLVYLDGIESDAPTDKDTYRIAVDLSVTFWVCLAASSKTLKSYRHSKVERASYIFSYPIEVMTISGIGICQRHFSFARVLARFISIYKREAASDRFLKNRARKAAWSI